MTIVVSVAQQKHYDVIGSAVARILREERERKGLSMNAVAERAGLSQSMVSLVEREMRKPTLDTLLRIADALEIDPADVLDRARRGKSRQ